MRNSSERKICVICEGFEELDYLNALINKAVFSNKYEFVLVNSKSINNISSIYQIRYQSNSYDLVLVFCDTEKLSTDDNVASSTNILNFLKMFENDDTNWIDEINNELI